MLANLTVTGPRYGPVGPDALPAAFRKTVAAERRPTLAEAREDQERTMVRDALGRHRSVARTAGELGVTRQCLSKLMARLQVDRFDPGRDRSTTEPAPLAAASVGAREAGHVRRGYSRSRHWGLRRSHSAPLAVRRMMSTGPPTLVGMRCAW